MVAGLVARNFFQGFLLLPPSYSSSARRVGASGRRGVGASGRRGVDPRQPTRRFLHEP
jgi:hypothetical protein